MRRRSVRPGSPRAAGPRQHAPTSAEGSGQGLGLRVLGPNCVGLLVPGIGLNASFAHRPAKPGHLGFVAQSGAIVTCVLDWADACEIGFSSLISLGDMGDVDFGDLPDYLAGDAGTAATPSELDRILPRTSPHAKPVDMIRNAAGTRYREALAVLRRDPGVDAILALHCPTAVVSAPEALEASEAMASAPTAPGVA